MLSSRQLHEALIFWFGTYQHRQVDRELDGFHSLKSTSNWLEKVREAQHLTKIEVARRLDISPTSYAAFEKNELDCTITLSTLKKAAKALDCELIYAIRPKNKKMFALPLWEKLIEISVEHPWVTKRPEMLKARALAAVARMNERKIRRKFTLKPQRLAPVPEIVITMERILWSPQ